MLVVSDTSPIRALQAIGRIDLIGSMYGRVLIPPAVARELDHEGLGVSPFAVGDRREFEVRSPTDLARVEEFRQRVDHGESEALALALELRADRVLIDEHRGRTLAISLGLHPIGVLALLVDAKNRGLVSRVEPLLDELDLRIRFRVSEKIRAQILRAAGERR